MLPSCCRLCPPRGREDWRRSGLGRAPSARPAPVPRVPSAHSRRDRKEVSVLCCRDLLLLLGKREPRYERLDPGRLWRGPGAEPRGGGSECGTGGQRGDPGRLLQPPTAAPGSAPRAPASSPGGSGGPSPAPPASCARPCRGHTPSHPGRLRLALCGAGSRQEPSDRRGLSPPRTLSALGVGPAYLWLPGRSRPPRREVSRKSVPRKSVPRDWASSPEPRGRGTGRAGAAREE